MTTFNHTVLLRILFLLFISSIYSSQLKAQTSSSRPGNQASVAATDADILNIRQMFKSINALKLTKQRFTYESAGCVEEGVVNYFLNNKKIVKVTESGFIGDGGWVNEYYYDNGKVIFCLETIEGGPAIGKTTKTQYRYYIKNGKPLRVMEGNKIIPPDSKVTDMLKNANNMYKAYLTKNFVGALCN
jgi:hypothetical protein